MISLMSLVKYVREAKLTPPKKRKGDSFGRKDSNTWLWCDDKKTDAR